VFVVTSDFVRFGWFLPRKGLEVMNRVVGRGNAATRTLARLGNLQRPIKHNIAAPYIPLSGTSERNRHRATIHRRRANPYPYCLPAKASRPPCGFAVLSSSSSVRLSLLSTHTSVSFCYPYQDPLTLRVSIPTALLARAGAFSPPLTCIARAAFCLRRVSGHLRASDQVSHECMRQLHVHPHVLNTAY
jgi:hypothetical protein